MIFYGNIERIVELLGTGFAESDVTVAIQNVITNWIDEHVYEAGFGENISADEYYDIKNDNQTELMLKNFPVISISSIINDSQSDSAVTVNSDSYVVDNDTGIVQLITAVISAVDDTYINSFTKGFNSVRVQYEYGFGDVPEVIRQLANLLTAKWIKTKDVQAQADGLKSVSIGDYKETFDSNFTSVKSEYDDMITSLLNKAKSKYAKGY